MHIAKERKAVVYYFYFFGHISDFLNRRTDYREQFSVKRYSDPTFFPKIFGRSGWMSPPEKGEDPKPAPRGVSREGRSAEERAPPAFRPLA